ncbi:hypothetical protein SF301_3630 [Shigella flexneri 2a str. 301]|nr:hypothetical protein SF301_3630 [Shigella flexneri 2a str. 301]
MRTFLKSHPEIDIQLTIDYGLTDVVSERFDAGVLRCTGNSGYYHLFFF